MVATLPTKKPRPVLAATATRPPTDVVFRQVTAWCPWPGADRPRPTFALRLNATNVAAGIARAQTIGPKGTHGEGWNSINVGGATRPLTTPPLS